MTNFIYNEILLGVVDGINKEFTALYDIESVEDLRLWGVDYVDFSFVNNVVTLADAPTLLTGGPSLDYFKVTLTPTTASSNVNFGQFTTDLYEDIGQDNTSYLYPLTMVKRYVKEELLINLNKRINPLRKVGTYSFNKAKDCTASAYDATEIDVTSIPTYTPANGAILLGNAEFVKYWAISTTAFTTLTNLSIIYKGGDKVTIGYVIPTGVKKISEVMVNGFPLTFKDLREFTINDVGCYTVWEGFLFLPRTMNESIVTVTYTKDNITPSEDTDLMDFEPEYLQVVRFSAMVKLFAFRGDERLNITAELYKDAWRNYKNYIAKQVDGTNNVIQTHAYKGFSSGTIGRGYGRR